MLNMIMVRILLEKKYWIWLWKIYYYSRFQKVMTDNFAVRLKQANIVIKN